VQKHGEPALSCSVAAISMVLFSFVSRSR